MVEGFILLSYVLGTAFGWYVGTKLGRTKGIVDTIDSLIDQGYLKWKGHKNNPEIMKHDEKDF
jgi:hypothetical protein